MEERGDQGLGSEKDKEIEKLCLQGERRRVESGEFRKESFRL